MQTTHDEKKRNQLPETFVQKKKKRIPETQGTHFVLFYFQERLHAQLSRNEAQNKPKRENHRINQKIDKDQILTPRNGKRKTQPKDKAQDQQSSLEKDHFFFLRFITGMRKKSEKNYQ